MKNLVLIGMMGSGKTTVGELLARQLCREFVDTDELIEAREGRAISRIFAEEGEGYFRARELEVCRELGPRENLVISCGGGLPLQEGCMEALRENGVVLWLDRDPGETYDQLDTANRPLAQGGRKAFLRRYESRAPIYRRWADHEVAAPSPEEAAITIRFMLESEERVP